MNISFEKWHGCQNDFIVVFSNPNQKELLDALQNEARKLCSKNGSSIGADGILVLDFEESSEQTFTPLKLTIINQDGSIASNCGNGLRCAALACYKRALEAERKVDIPDAFELKVLEKKFLCRFSEELNAEGLPEFVTISMGEARLNDENSWDTEAREAIQKVNTDLNSPFSFEDIFTCHLSNNHIVLLTHDLLNEEAFYRLSEKLQHSFSWDGINVHLAKELGKAPSKTPCFLQKSSSFYEILHFERGCGPTQGCGSGATSLAASIFQEGFLEKGDSIGVKMPGGFVSIINQGAGLSLELSGPASFVFKGKLTL